MSQTKQDTQQSSNEQQIVRWTAKRKLQVVLELFKGYGTPAEIARKYGLTQSQLFEWQEQVTLGGGDEKRGPSLVEHFRHSKYSAKMIYSALSMPRSTYYVRLEALSAPPKSKGRQRADEAEVVAHPVRV